MKTKIDSIRLIFESILCHCAEGSEFMNKSQILELIAKEASQGMKECDELDQIREEVNVLISELERREEENPE